MDEKINSTNETSVASPETIKNIKTVARSIVHKAVEGFTNRGIEFLGSPSLNDVKMKLPNGSIRIHNSEAGVEIISTYLALGTEPHHDLEKFVEKRISLTDSGEQSFVRSEAPASRSLRGSIDLMKPLTVVNSGVLMESEANKLETDLGLVDGALG